MGIFNESDDANEENVDIYRLATMGLDKNGKPLDWGSDQNDKEHCQNDVERQERRNK